MSDFSWDEFDEACGKPKLVMHKGRRVFVPLKPNGQLPTGPIPFTNELPPVPRFDLALLPESLRGYVANMAQRFDNTAPDYLAVAAMVSLSSLVGSRATIQPKKFDDWSLPANLWGCTVGPVSTKKTPALQAVLSMVNKIQSEKHDDEFKRAMAEYKAKKRVYTCVMRALETELQAKLEGRKLRNKTEPRDIFVIQAEMAREESEEPKEPQRRCLVANDATVEAMQKLMAGNPQGMMLYRDELAGWLGRMLEEQYQAERAFYLESFEGHGNRFHQARITRDAPELSQTVLSILGGIQPDKLHKLLVQRRDGVGNDGLFERLQLAVYPDVTGEASDIGVNTEARERAELLFRQCAELMDGEPIVHRFDEEAQAVFTEWYGSFTNHLPTLSPSRQAILGKHPALVAKLALLLHIADGGIGRAVSLAALERALEWRAYLEAHAIRILAPVEDPYASARSLLSKLPKLPDPFTASDFRNKEWSHLKTEDQRKAALAELVRRSYLTQVEEDTGGRPLTRYQKNTFLRETPNPHPTKPT